MRERTKREEAEARVSNLPQEVVVVDGVPLLTRFEAGGVGEDGAREVETGVAALHVPVEERESWTLRETEETRLVCGEGDVYGVGAEDASLAEEVLDGGLQLPAEPESGEVVEGRVALGEVVLVVLSLDEGLELGEPVRVRLERRQTEPEPVLQSLRHGIQILARLGPAADEAVDGLAILVRLVATTLRYSIFTLFTESGERPAVG